MTRVCARDARRGKQRRVASGRGGIEEERAQGWENADVDNVMVRFCGYLKTDNTQSPDKATL